MYLKKELYELIRTDERVFDFIQESSLDGLWYWDLENPENEWMNAKFWTVLGYNPEEMPHKSSAWQGIINQEDLKLAKVYLARHFENPTFPYDQNVRYKHKNGSTMWIRCRGMAIRDSTGKPIRMLGAHQDISELKRSEQELFEANKKVHDSEEKFRAFFNYAPLSYQSLDENGCFIDINPMWLKTLGYERSEVIGKWYGDFLHPDYVEHFRKNFPAFKKRGYVSDIQFRLRKKDSTYIYVSFEGCVGYTPEGKFKQTYCVFKDITEEKALENALIKAKEKAEQSEADYRKLFESLKQERILLRTIIDSLPDSIYVKDLEYRKVLSNTANFQSCGFSNEEELIGKTDFDLFPVEIAEKFLEDDKKVLLQGISIVNREEFILKPNGDEKWLLTSKLPLYNNKGSIIGLAGIGRDITERKRTEEALRKSEERFQLAVKASNDGLFDWNLETNSIYYSPAWKKMLGYEDNELPNDFSIWETNTQPEYVEKSWELQKKLISKQVDRFVLEIKMKHKDGHWVDILSRAKAIFNESGQAIRIVGTHTDITGRKLTEQLLQEKSREIAAQNEELYKKNSELIAAKEKAEESDRLKSAFLANMSHEIRTPMNGIIGFADLLKEPGLSGEEQQAYIKIIEKSGTRMLNIINQIVDISRIESGLMKLDINHSNINEQVEYAYTFFKPEAEAKGIKLSFINTLPNKKAIIKTDREKVYAILTNLVKNAIKYTEQGSIDLGYDVLQMHENESKLQFFVKDTGIGIPNDRHEAIFERFIQADVVDRMAYQGAGLGLAITKAYVEMLGGEIWVESKEGKGSTFYFTLPFNVSPQKT